MISAPIVSFPSKIPEAASLKFVVIVSKNIKGEWIFVRHRERGTWEIPGGHIEKGEGYFDAARRELKEETGAFKYDMKFISFYSVERNSTESDKNISYGALFLADVFEFSPAFEHEIAETKLFKSLPEELTYPLIQPLLFAHVQGWLNINSTTNELWDIYDSERRLTGRTHRRGVPIPEGDYHLVVSAWIKNAKGEYLITKRAANKGFPNMWENTGGSAIAGDDSLSAVLREIKEETGLDIPPESGRRILAMKAESDFNDIWLFEYEVDLNDIVLQEGETTDARIATKDEILKMIKTGEFIPIHYLDDFIEKF